METGFLTFNNEPYDLLYAIQIPAAVAMIKVPGHLKLDSVEARGYYLAENVAKNAALKSPTDQFSVMELSSWKDFQRMILEP